MRKPVLPVVAATLALTLSACGSSSSGDGGAGGDRDGAAAPSAPPGPLKEVHGQIQYAGGRYYNACNLLRGHDLSTALKTRFTGSVQIQEEYAEAAVDPAYLENGLLDSDCVLRGLGSARNPITGDPSSGDIDLDARVVHYPDEASAQSYYDLDTKDGTPFSSAARAVLLVDRRNHTLHYVGLIGAAFLDIAVDTDSDDQPPATPMATVERELAPGMRDVFADIAKTDSHAAALPGGTYGTTRVLDACRVLSAATAESVFARDPRLTTAAARKADPSDITRTRSNGGPMAPGELLSSNCVRNSAPVDDLSRGGTPGGVGSVSVGIDFYPDAQQAADEFGIYSRGHKPVRGAGVPAYVDTSGDGPELDFRKGPYLVRTTVAWWVPRGTGEPSYATNASDLVPLVKQLVKQLQ